MKSWTSPHFVAPLLREWGMKWLPSNVWQCWWMFLVGDGTKTITDGINLSACVKLVGRLEIRPHIWARRWLRYVFTSTCSFMFTVMNTVSSLFLLQISNDNVFLCPKGISVFPHNHNHAPCWQERYLTHPKLLSLTDLPPLLAFTGRSLALVQIKHQMISLF